MPDDDGGHLSQRSGCHTQRGRGGPRFRSLRGGNRCNRLVKWRGRRICLCRQVDLGGKLRIDLDRNAATRVGCTGTPVPRRGSHLQRARDATGACRGRRGSGRGVDRNGCWGWQRGSLHQSSVDGNRGPGSPVGIALTSVARRTQVNAARGSGPAWMRNLCAGRRLRRDLGGAGGGGLGRLHADEGRALDRRKSRYATLHLPAIRLSDSIVDLTDTCRSRSRRRTGSNPVVRARYASGFPELLQGWHGC